MGSNLFSPDNFADDWYGWLTNQISHIFLGLFLVFVISIFGFAALGEFPYKIHIFGVVLAGYFLLIELYLQGWRGWDTVEDTLFVVVYGAGGVLSASFELEVGDAAIIMELEPLVPFFVVSSAHLAAGVLWRVAK